MNRIAVIAKLYHPAVKFGNDFCNGHLARQCEEQSVRSVKIYLSNF